MSSVIKLAAAGMAIAMTAASLSPAAAAPLSAFGNAAAKSAAEVSQVDKAGYRHRGHYRRHRGGDALAAGALGLAAGALIGGSLAQPRYYYAPPPPPRVYYQPAPAYGYGYTPPMWSADWYSYCASKYRSFDPSSGTYLGYDGYRRYCQ